MNCEASVTKTANSRAIGLVSILSKREVKAQMKIREICNTHVVTASPGDSIISVAQTMRQHHVGDVVVIGAGASGRVPVGIITDRDIVVGLIAQGIDDLSRFTAEDVMGQELITARAEEEAHAVAAQMILSGKRRLPVVNKEGLLVGIVTYDDLFGWMADELSDLARLGTRQSARERRTRT